MIPDDDSPDSIRPDDDDYEPEFDEDCDCEDCQPYNAPRDNPTPQDLDNLTTLAAYLRTVPPENFDYEKWGETGAACGTVACALGHAVLGPFANLGFTLEPSVSWQDGKTSLSFCGNGKGVAARTVIRTFFGDGEEVNDLFYPTADISRHDPEAVADRIDDYVDQFR